MAAALQIVDQTTSGEELGTVVDSRRIDRVTVREVEIDEKYSGKSDDTDTYPALHPFLVVLPKRRAGDAARREPERESRVNRKRNHQQRKA